MIMVAFKVRLHAGHSAAQSPYAKDPPVPRLRIARWAICGAAALSKGACFTMRSESFIGMSN